jgi:hypothetical protein
LPEDLRWDDEIMGEYQPGTCNIGSAEIARRKRTGFIGVGATAILGLALVLFHLPAVWRLSLFVPAFFAATGFLQGFMHFCAGFGMRGVFNFGPQVGKTEEVEQAEYRRKDKQKALQILAYSALISIVVATAIFFLPL